MSEKSLKEQALEFLNRDPERIFPVQTGPEVDDRFAELEKQASWLTKLTPRELQVILLIRGLALTHDEVGKRMDVPRERIRQTEAKACRKMSHSEQGKHLQRFITGE